MMKVQQNMNYQNIQNCIIKYPVIIQLTKTEHLATTDIAVLK